MNIYIPVLASEVEKNAANELSVYLQKACGTDFPILSEKDTCCPGIYVGYTDFAASHGVNAQGGRNSLDGVEAWVIRAVDGSLVLTGGKKNTDRGIIYAVEHYLEDVIGVRFWNALEEYVPTIPAFTIDPTLDLSGEPEMEMRFPIACSFIGDDRMLSIRRRHNNTGIPTEWGGCITASPRGGCHTVNLIMRPTDELFQAHPDWFAWNDRQQRRLPYGQYCLNNEEFLQAFEKAFIDDIAHFYAEADAAGKPRPSYFHISMNDTSYDCQCPVCKERVARSGGTGNVLRFVNRMAQAAEKVYPGIKVETLVYWTYMELPLDDTVPAKNVIVRLADLEIDILHSLSYPTNAHMLEVLKGWSDICRKGGNPLAIWDYNINVRLSTIVPNTFRLAENFRIYADHGVIGHFVEHEEPLLSDFWCLKNWLLSHLMEDCRIDDRAMIRRFMDEYYGAAAPALMQWLEAEEAACAQSPLRMRCVENFTKADFVPYELYVEGCRLFDEAEAAVQYDEVLTRRVRQARAPLDLSILVRYDSILYMAAHRGVTFPVARETAAIRYALTVQQTRDMAADYCREHNIALPRWQGNLPLLQWQTAYKPVPMPEQFAGTDTLAVPLWDFATEAPTELGMVYDRDPSAPSGFSARLQLDRAPDFIRDESRMLHRGEEGHHYAMTLRHNGKVLRREFTLEDVKPGEYALYHLFDLDDLTEGSNSLLTLTRASFTTHISGFAVALPTEKVSIWVNAKFTGAAYGGDEQDPDAIWFDRLFFVPRT